LAFQGLDKSFFKDWFWMAIQKEIGKKKLTDIGLVLVLLRTFGYWFS
jgi:hypothetical protein